MEEGGGEEVAIDELNGLQRGRGGRERGAGKEIVVAVDGGEVVATASAREIVGIGEDIVDGERGVDLVDEVRLLSLERKRKGILRRRRWKGRSYAPEGG